MENLMNNKLEEESFEMFRDELDNHYDLRGDLACYLLEGAEYYLFCKEDHWELLDDALGPFYDDLLRWDWEETVRNPFEAAKRYLSAVASITSGAVL